MKKRCTGCKQEKIVSEDKALSEFYCYANSDRPRARCKVCINDANLARQASDPEKYNARTNAWREKNPGRASQISRAWQLRHPEQARAIAYQVMYGKGFDFDTLWQAQDGKCAACDLPMTPRGRDPESVCVDHDRSCCKGRRSCGKCVRGLIHRNCNLMMGYALDNATLLRKAASYLEQWQSRTLK